MATKRSAGQKLINFPVKEEFIEDFNRKLTTVGYSNRAEFIREAIVEKFQGLGVEISVDMIAPPSRLGKGGRQEKKRIDDKKSSC